jgi:hypothetical protein
MICPIFFRNKKHAIFKILLQSTLGSVPKLLSVIYTIYFLSWKQCVDITKQQNSEMTTKKFILGNLCQSATQIQKKNNEMNGQLLLKHLFPRKITNFNDTS